MKFLRNCHVNQYKHWLLHAWRHNYNKDIDSLSVCIDTKIHGNWFTISVSSTSLSINTRTFFGDPKKKPLLECIRYHFQRVSQFCVFLPWLPLTTKAFKNAQYIDFIYKLQLKNQRINNHKLWMKTVIWKFNQKFIRMIRDCRFIWLCILKTLSISILTSGKINFKKLLFTAPVSLLLFRFNDESDKCDTISLSNRINRWK